MQDFKASIVKTLLFILCIPPLSIGFLSFRPHQIYKCIRVIDGDTAVFERNSQQIRVRFSYIDAPESKQLSFDQKPIGYESKTYLKNRIENKLVSLKILNTDMYGRKIGEIFLSNKSINLEMVSSGYAIPYHLNTKYQFRQAQYIAMNQRLGIWKYDGFISPWSFRQNKRK
jgi:endonuclease YncB( thermonuclease family)